MQSLMVACQDEADLLRGRPEVQPMIHGRIRSCTVCGEIDLAFIAGMVDNIICQVIPRPRRESRHAAASVVLARCRTVLALLWSTF